ncbi:MAG: GGDEF domain-containing protein [candidate division Zixibacteria bacterium]|nr:GGDEF domain-containing protein [candidate division Zixibacteria bacterium]
MPMGVTVSPASEWDAIAKDVLPGWLAAESLECLCHKVYPPLRAACGLDRLLIVWRQGSRPAGWAQSPPEADALAVHGWYDALRAQPVFTGGSADTPDLATAELRIDEPLRRMGLVHTARVHTAQPAIYDLYWSHAVEAPGGSGLVGTPLWRALELALANHARVESLRELTHIDTLSGAFNRRYFNLRLMEEVARSDRFGRPLSLIIADLDHFKPLNDTQGHQAGDVVLRYVGQAVRRSVRSIDILCRLGGDEFAVLMPDTDAAECALLGERLCRGLGGHEFSLHGHPAGSGDAFQLHLSLGGAVHPDQADRAERLLWCADMALLEAKRRGGNRFVFYDSATVGGAKA